MNMNSVYHSDYRSNPSRPIPVHYHVTAWAIIAAIAFFLFAFMPRAAALPGLAF